MNIELIRDYILLKPHVTEGFPFGENVLVFKVVNRLFFLSSLVKHPFQFNVKCDPDKAIELRERYPTVILPGFHMNKQHWNTIIVDGTLSNKQLLSMIDDSYRLVGNFAK